MTDDLTELLGFSNAPSTGGGDFPPYVKYNAKAGRIMRVDRELTAQGWVTSEVDISIGFLAQFDMEHAETGWMNFGTSGPPQFHMVPIFPKAKLPDAPQLADGTVDKNYKTGLRFMIKLATAVADGKPRIRELASNAKAFIDGTAPMIREYREKAAQHPGLLPILALTGVRPVKSGGQGREQTNFAPVFVIHVVNGMEQWAPRGDLQPRPRVQGTMVTPPAGNGWGAPATGAQPAQAPVQRTTPVQPAAPVVQRTYDPNDFG